MVRSLERELKEALDDLATIRKAKSPSEKRNICYCKLLDSLKE
jgi:hypothetical protein